MNLYMSHFLNRLLVVHRYFHGLVYIECRALMDQTIIYKVRVNFFELWKLVLVFIYDNNHTLAMLVGALRAFPLVVDPPSRVEGALLWRKSPPPCGEDHKLDPIWSRVDAETIRVGGCL